MEDKEGAIDACLFLNRDVAFATLDIFPPLSFLQIGTTRAAATMSSSYQLQQLTAKLNDSDFDVRLMGLTDIQRKVAASSEGGVGSGNAWSVDDSTETALVDKVLSLFNDSIAEVKSNAAKTISVLVPKVKEDRVQTIIEKLTQMTSNKDDALRDVASLGEFMDSRSIGYPYAYMQPITLYRTQDRSQGDLARFKAGDHCMHEARPKTARSAQERMSKP